MKVESNRRDYRSGYDSTNDSRSFQEHNEKMKAFRRSHGSIALVNSPRHDKLSTLAATCPWQLHRTMMETGGSRLVNDIADWSFLVPISEVRQHRFWKN